MSAPATEADGPGAVPRQAGRLTSLRPRQARLLRIARHELTLVSACYLLAALAVTALLWKDPASRIVAGNSGDPNLAAWWMRYSAQAVAHWRLPALITTAMNTPTGINAMWNTSLLAPGVALSLVTLLFGPQVSLTVLVTAGFAGSAASLYWVLRQWQVTRLAAAAGGLAYGFSPALAQSAIGHYHMQFAVFPPLIAHLVARLLTRPAQRPAKDGAALGLLAAVQLLTCEELLFNTALAIVVGMAVAGVSKVRSIRGGVSAEALLGLASGAMTAAGVFVMIAGYPLWVQFHGPFTQHGSPFLLDFYKNDLEGFIEPSRLQLIHSAGSAAFADRFQGGAAEYLGYLGWPMLLATPFIAISLWRMLAVRVLAVTFLVLEVFSVGGMLLAGGNVHDWLKFPWYWVQGLPLASSAIVDRFSIIADGCAAILLAIVIDAAWRAVAGSRVTVRRRVAARMAIGLVTAVVVVPMLPAPLPASAVPGVPQGWTQVMTALRMPDGAGVLTVPVATGSYPTPLRWQADTGLPAAMVGGFFIGPVPGGQAYMGGPGLGAVPQYLNWLWAQSPPSSVDSTGVQTSSTSQPIGTASTWISGTGVSAVVAVTSLNSPLARYLTATLGRPAAQSGDVIGWRVDRGR